MTIERTENRARMEVTCKTSKVTTAESILGYEIPEPKNISRGLPPTEIGKKPLIVIEEITPHGNSIYTAAIRKRLCGLRQNQVYWEIAPSSAFGLDLNDYKSDHTRLLSHDPRYDRVRELHESLGKPWKIYRRYGPGQLEAIQNQQIDNGKINPPFLFPVVRWTKSADSKRSFIFSPFMHSEEGKEKLRKFLGRWAPKSPLFENTCDPALGLYVLALFSPDQRKNWPSNAGINGQGHQTLGSTQAPLWALLRERDLAESPFLLSAELHVRFNNG